MKKLIAISVVFALVAGAAFAVDLGATVIGTANVLQGTTDKDPAGDSIPVTSGGGMNQFRLNGSGENDDGTFGGWIRYSGDGGGSYGHYGAPVAGIAWWKPMDMFKLSIGGNPDGIFAKEGNSAWMFYQTVSDTGVVNAGNAWGGGYGADAVDVVFRSAFFGGFGDERVFMTITPAEMVDINIAIPFLACAGQETKDVFMQTVAQIDLKMDFGNIALTYVGGRGHKEAQAGVEIDTGKVYDKDGPYVIDQASGTLKQEYNKGDPIKVTVGKTDEVNEPGKIFAYYNGSFGDLTLDFGLGFGFPKYDATEDKNINQPLGIGLAVKYAMDTLGVKFRTVVSLPMYKTQHLSVLADVLPYFVLGDNLTAFVGFGLAMAIPNSDEKDQGAESITGWHFNPYLQVGEEWGAKFLFGIKAYSDGDKKYGEKGDATKVDWAVPIALIINF